MALDQFIPLRNIKEFEINNEYEWIINKIAFILYSDSFNEYAINTARSILNFIDKAGFCTFKQAKLIKELKPKKI